MEIETNYYLCRTWGHLAGATAHTKVGHYFCGICGPLRKYAVQAWDSHESCKVCRFGENCAAHVEAGTCVEEGWKSPGPVSGVGQVVKESSGQAKQC